MPRLWFLMFLCLSLLTTPLGHSQEISVENDVQLIPAGSPERVYGVDYSKAIHNLVSLSSYKNFIIKLTENGSRFYTSESNVQARSWIQNQLESVSEGRIEVEIIGSHNSIAGRLPGYLPGNKPVLMVGGHYDTVPEAPGANDDAVGVAAALELARVMSMYEWPLDIFFCAWNAEEVGLFGSAEVANEFRQRDIEILMYYNVDMLLVEDPDAPVDERVWMVHRESEATWAYLTKMASQNHGLGLIKPLSSLDFFGWQLSDHASFLQAGYENVMFAFESGFSYDSAYHSPTDTWDNPLYNYTVAIEAVKSIGSSIAFVMARAHDEPTRQMQDCTLGPGQTKKLYVAINFPTQINIEAIWNGGKVEFSLYGPDDLLIVQLEANATVGDFGSIMNASASKEGIYTMIVENTDYANITCQLAFIYESDVDRDGIADRYQFWLDSAEFEKDNDGDGISNGDEIILGTSPWDEDSDQDTMPDRWEVENGLDPLVADGEQDLDGDGLTNAEEFENQTDPNLPDSDGDGLTDKQEVIDYGTNPLSNDTDNDLMPDAWEIANELNPLIDDSGENPDADEYTNLEEYMHGTNPNVSDYEGGFGWPTLVLVSSIVIITVVVVASFTIKRHIIADY